MNDERIENKMEEAKLDRAGNSTVPLKERVVQCWRRNWRWVWADVAAPLLLTRLALLLVGWFTQYLPTDLHYPARLAAERGWSISTHRWLDIWLRWDGGWLLGVASKGYVIYGDTSTVQSNIAFFPLYPYLVRVVSFLLPDAWNRLSVLLLIGVILSNLLLFGGLITLYRMVLSFFGDKAIARRAVFYVLIFPSSFALSSFMTEGTFFFFLLLAFYAAFKRVWWAAGVCGCCVALTRHMGVVVFLPLAWMYLESANWNFRKIRWNALWLLLIPAGTLAFLLSVYPLTKDLLAPVQVQGAWERHFTLPWKGVIHPAFGFIPNVTPIEQVLFFLFLLCAVGSLFLLPSMGFGLLALILIFLPPSTGTMIGFARYCSVMFPVFIVLAWLGRRSVIIDKSIVILFLTFQALFMLLWCQFYLIF